MKTELQTPEKPSKPLGCESSDVAGELEAGRSIQERVLLRLPTPFVRLVMRGLARLHPDRICGGGC